MVKGNKINNSKIFEWNVWTANMVSHDKVVFVHH